MALANCICESGAKTNICFDCKNACGGCSWSELDKRTGKPRFKPVPGWTAKKVMLNIGHTRSGNMWRPTYHITDCPQFIPDDSSEIRSEALRAAIKRYQNRMAQLGGA